MAMRNKSLFHTEDHSKHIRISLCMMSLILICKMLISAWASEYEEVICRCWIQLVTRHHLKCLQCDLKCMHDLFHNTICLERLAWVETNPIHATNLTVGQIVLQLRNVDLHKQEAQLVSTGIILLPLPWSSLQATQIDRVLHLCTASQVRCAGFWVCPCQSVHIKPYTARSHCSGSRSVTFGSVVQNCVGPGGAATQWMLVFGVPNRCQLPDFPWPIAVCLQAILCFCVAVEGLKSLGLSSSCFISVGHIQSGHDIVNTDVFLCEEIL